jgi:hypothetical protein
VVEEALAQGQGQQRDMAVAAAGVCSCDGGAVQWWSDGSVGGSRRMNCGPEGNEAIGWTGWRRATWPVDWSGAASSSQFVDRVDVDVDVAVACGCAPA